MSGGRWAYYTYYTYYTRLTLLTSAPNEWREIGDSMSIAVVASMDVSTFSKCSSSSISSIS